MGEKNTRTRKKQEKDRKRWRKLTAGGLLLAVCCLVGGISARYIHQTISRTSQITSEHYYFTVDLLGDTTMVADTGETSDTFAFGEESTEGTWSLYGAGEHEIAIQVQNYYDNLRITEKEISYTASVTAKNPDGTEVAGDKLPTLQTTDRTEFTKGTLEGDQESAETITLVVPSYTNWSYEDGTIVTVTLHSTAPYTKTLTLHFQIYATDNTLQYEIVDSVGSPYAELILMTNVENHVQPVISWPEALSIDNSNRLTFTYQNGAFTPQAGMENRTMQISEKLQSGRSESIYFFKADTSKDYTCGRTVINPAAGGTYTITINEK